MFVNRNTDLGKSFFKAVATPASVKKILCEVSMEDRCKRSSSFIGFFFLGFWIIQYSIYLLLQCYHDDSAVTDELVEKILSPGLQPGAVDVFLDFICYSGGPLPEELLPDIKVKVDYISILSFIHSLNETAS